jgi:hypothetical protein
MVIVNELAASKITEEIKILRSCPHSERRQSDKKGKVKTLGAAVQCTGIATPEGFPLPSLSIFFFLFLHHQLANNAHACYSAKLVFQISVAGIWNILDNVDFCWSWRELSFFSFLCVRVFIQMTFKSQTRCLYYALMHLPSILSQSGTH